MTLEEIKQEVDRIANECDNMKTYSTIGNTIVFDYSECEFPRSEKIEQRFIIKSLITRGEE